MMWKLPGSGGEAAEEPDTETAFLLKICNVVERLIDEERRALQTLNVDIPSAAVAYHYVNVAVANAGLRAHAAVHRLFDCRVPADTGRLTTDADWNCVVDQFCGDPGMDLRVLAEVRKLAFRTRLEQAAGVEDWQPTTSWVTDHLDRDEAAARKMMSDEVSLPCNNSQSVILFSLHLLFPV